MASATRLIALRAFAVAAACALLQSCAAVGVALLGVGGTAGTSHHMGGVNYRTFTEPRGKVEVAAYAALKRMGIKVESTERQETTTMIKASTEARIIEVEIEALTPQTTRVRSVAYQYGGLLTDGATGGEIIQQTEVALTPKAPNKANGNGNPQPKPVAKRGA
jgi:hypothetical protein